MAIGPMQFIAITFDDFKPRGEIMSALRQAVDAGIIRLVDLQFVRKDEAGQITQMEMSGLTASEASEFGGVIGGLLSAGAGDSVDVEASLGTACR